MGLYLLILIVLITISPAFVRIIQPEPEKVSNDILAKLDFNFIQTEELNQPNNYAQNNYKNYKTDIKSDNYQNSNTFVKSITLFEFNPNTISKEQWEQLGVSKFAAERLVNYVAKGGKFKSKSDLLKTYGFTQEDFERLEPYIKIDSIENVKSVNNTLPDIAINRVTTNINTASKEQFMQLGFSADNAMRIIKFRENAGGIYSSEQLTSLFGIDMAVLSEAQPFLVADENEIVKLNINTATTSTLAAHIYISDEMAQAIVDYRNATGKFYSLSEIRKVPGMYAGLFEKLKPYLIL
ncbi:MAG: helix-hairpin-helix domain-containing protein [Bacteroidetes bacterium]|nr:helix-hairpin-helix domain-containing protein [Bacteroidota bacterium]